MRITHHATGAINALWANKMRSGLTMLGIVIGIASIILMMSLGSGTEQLILGEIGSLGAETIIVRPGKEPTGPSDIGETLFADSLKERDVKALRRKSNLPAVKDVMPALFVPGSVSFEGETYRPTILGGDAEFFGEVWDVYPAQGEFYDESDIRARGSVAVIGSKVAEELFGNADPVGKRIKIKDKKFRVTGVFSDKGQSTFFNFDELVVVPYTTAQTYLLGISHYHELIVRANSPEDAARTVQDIERTLRELHNITDPEKDDFFVVTQEGLVNQIKTIISALTSFLAAIIAIALVVGGIGIMNIMLVSVTERTREIGLRKAVGATKKDIRMQFLLEAVFLTAIGGVLGIIIGASMSFVVSIIITKFSVLNWQFVFPFSVAVLSVFVSAVVGIIFGIYPAQKAAKKSPMDALRYE
jgi:putative ABC transport system permease protein